MGVGGLVALAAALATPSVAPSGPRGKLRWGWMAIFWVLDSAVMVIALVSMFPRPFA
jgi:hypothetical protein